MVWSLAVKVIQPFLKRKEQQEKEYKPFSILFLTFYQLEGIFSSSSLILGLQQSYKQPLVKQLSQSSPVKRCFILSSALANSWEVCAQLVILEIILDISKLCMNLVQLCISRMCVE